jgi:hypothetical protein
MRSGQRQQTPLRSLEVFVPFSLQTVLRHLGLMHAAEQHAPFVVAIQFVLDQRVLSLGIASLVETKGRGVDLQLALLPLEDGIDPRQLGAQFIDFSLPDAHVVVPQRSLARPEAMIVVELVIRVSKHASPPLSKKNRLTGSMPSRASEATLGPLQKTLNCAVNQARRGHRGASNRTSLCGNARNQNMAFKTRRLQ